MRYAIFSDIHGNLPAWEQVLADIRSLEADVLICLGDVVGYGPRPQEVLDGIRSVTDNFVLGNHDAAAAGLIDPAIFNEHAHSVVLWTRENLTRESLEFFRNVPLQLESEDILFVHAEISVPGRFGYVEGIADAEESFGAAEHFVTFIGHTHHPLMFEQLPHGAVNLLPDEDRKLDPKCRYIVNVGSAGEPRNADDIRSRYVIYDSDTRSVYFRRVDFDADAYRRDLSTTTLTQVPFFLQVLDSTTGLDAVNAQDMHVPAQAIQGFNTAQHTLVIPTLVGSGVKPKPMPASAASTGGKSASTIFSMVVGIVAVLVAGWWFFKGRSPNSIDQSLFAESSLVVPSDASSDAPLNGQGQSKPAPLTSMERLYSTEGPLVPVPFEENVVPGENPAKAKAKTPRPMAKASPKPVEAPPELLPPKIATIAHWPMNSESVEGPLRAGQGEVELRQVFPAKPFEKIAPDPLPQTSGQNPSSLSRGAWVEENPSGKFGLSGDASFAFEGWVLIGLNQAPVFLGGTLNDEGEPGWRLDMKTAETAEGPGSVRFLYSDGSQTVVAQNNEIPLNQPVPHHFAAVWNHDAISREVGKLQVYFDGKIVAETELPHSQVANQEEASPFRLSSADNPERIAMDEFRFSKGNLSPNNFLSIEPFRPGGLVTESGLVQGRLLYAVDDGQFDFNDPYTKDNSAEIAPGSFKRVGYFVELGNDWVWVSMDRFQTDPKLVGVPRAKTKIVENGTVVSNLIIDSSRKDLRALNRPGLTGIIEFWASNHGGDGKGLFGSNDRKWDWKDSGGTTQPGFGSFQVFAFTDDKQTAAVTLFGISLRGGSGIGDQDSQRAPDWTFGPGTNTYQKRNLEIWVGD